MARRLVVNPNTLWSWFHRRGLPVDKALGIANILSAWAMELLDYAQKLRELAEQHRNTTREGLRTGEDRSSVPGSVVVREPAYSPHDYSESRQ